MATNTSAAALQPRSGTARTVLGILLGSGITAIAAWLALALDYQQTTAAAIATGELVAGGFALVTIGLTIKRQSGRYRRAWILIGLFGLVNLVAIAASGINQSLLSGSLPLGSWVTVAAACVSLPLAFGAEASLLSNQSALIRWRTVLDALVVAGSVLFVIWSFLLEGLSPLSAGDTLTFLGPPISASIFLALAVTLVIRPDPTQRRVYILLAAALVSMTIAGAVDYHELTGNIFDLGWIAGFVFLALAARGMTAASPTMSLPYPDTDTPSAFLPYLAVGAAALAGASALITGNRIDPILEWDGVAMMALLAIRQATALRANLRLTSDLQHQTTALRSSEARFRSLVQNSSDAIIVLNNDGVISYVSPAADIVVGAPHDELLGAKLLSLVHPDDSHALTDHLEHVRTSERGWAAIQFRTRDVSGKWRNLEATPTNLVDDPDINGVVLNTRDITDRRMLEEQLRHQAFHDPLTRLANRALLRNRVEHALMRSRREGGQIALLFIDLDDFKDVNDTLGHGVGDQMLMTIADRIRSSLRETDTPARLGGDEFAVLLEFETSELETRAVARRIIQAIGTAVQVDENLLAVGASIGIAFGDSTATADELLRKADVAMYEAKANGKGDFAVFDNSMDLMVIARLQFEVEMHEALAADQLVAYYQPIVDINSGVIAGAEALVRWNHPTRGLLQPSEFVGLAEETGQIVAIGREMLRVACQQAHEWNVSGGDRYVSINLSSRHFQSHTLVADVARALEDSHLEGKLLVAEVTESALLADLAESRSQMDRLRELGVRIALDDFGTGYSSLGYLRELPVDMLKIDRSFVTDLGSGSRPTEFIRAIHTLSNSLSLTTIAEGVEDPKQLELLQNLGVGYGQGFILSRPVDSAAIVKLMKRGTFDLLEQKRVRAHSNQ